VNNFNPEKSKIPELYNGFRAEIQSNNAVEADLKDGIFTEDKPLDEALWLLETALNTNYGFRQDDLYDYETEVFEFTVSNKSINANGMPVIDGQELVETYYELVDAVDYSSSENQYFRFGLVGVSQVTTETSTFILESEAGLYANGILPPGVNPDPFPAGTNGTAEWAAAQFASKINLYSSLPPGTLDPDYIIRVIGAGPYSGMSHPDNLWWKESYSNCSYELNTNELNQYLLSTKAFIDFWNPINNPDIWVEHVYIWCDYDSNALEGFHVVSMAQLEKVFVGSGGQ